MTTVWLLDPAAMTPYYDISLTRALRAEGVEARLITSRFIYEDRVPLADETADLFFFRATAGWGRLLRRWALLRWAVRLIQYPFDWLRLMREFDDQPPDVLHVQWTWLPIIDGYWLARMARRVPLVITIHDTVPRAAAMTRLADMRPVYPLADWMIVHAEENRQAVMGYAQLDASRISVVPMGTQLDDQQPVERAEARRQLGAPLDAAIILFFGVIKPYKGLADLIAALPHVVRRVPSAHLLVAGAPQEKIDSYARQIDDLKLGDRVTLHVRFIPTEDVPLYFAASNVVCLPYREASQSAVLLTAYRFARPVVVTHVGALPETVRGGDNGFVVPPNSSSALADALIKVLSDPTLEARMGKRSGELAQNEFGWGQAARLAVQVYQDVLAERHSRR